MVYYIHMKNTNERLISILNWLSISDLEFMNFFNFSKDEFEIIKNDKSISLILNRNKKERITLEKFSEIYGYLVNFLNINTPKDILFDILNKKYSFENKEMKLIEIILEKDSYGSFTFVSNILLDRYTNLFKEIKIGSKMTYLDRLNKEISEMFFKHQVDVKDVWVYSDGGDYTELKVQSKVETFTDGSGDWWEDIKLYSSNINDSWLIIKELQKRGFSFSLNYNMPNDEENSYRTKYVCESTSGKSNEKWVFTLKKDDKIIDVEADSPSVAICFAALKSLI